MPTLIIWVARISSKNPLFFMKKKIGLRAFQSRNGIEFKSNSFKTIGTIQHSTKKDVRPGSGHTLTTCNSTNSPFCAPNTNTAHFCPTLRCIYLFQMKKHNYRRNLSRCGLVYKQTLFFIGSSLSLHQLFLTIALISAVLVSCRIEKRSYRPGFHIDWHQSAANKTQRDSASTSLSPQESIKNFGTTNQDAQPEAADLVFSNSKTHQSADSTASIVREPTSSDSIGWQARSPKKAFAWPRLLSPNLPGARRTDSPPAEGIEVKEAPVSFVLTFGSFVLAVALSAFGVEYDFVSTALGLIFLAGLVLSIVALQRYKRVENQRGKGLAIAALAFGILVIVLSIVFLIILLLVLAAIIGG